MATDTPSDSTPKPGNETNDSQPAPVAKTAEFSSLTETAASNSGTPIERFHDVQIPVWAELGRVEMTLGELMKLSEGAVVRLDRPISQPVDLISQGVKLAQGEVVVVDDCFAIRIKSIQATK